MSKKVAIFDWDGTVVDSIAHIAGSLRAAAQELGLPVLQDAQYRDIIGLGMVDALQTLYPGLEKPQMLAMRDAYGRHFFSRPSTPAQIFSGITDLLRDLGNADRGCAVATGKSRRGLDIALTNTGLAACFDITRCADETRSKPDPAMLIDILSHYEIDASEAVMIGDTTYDMEMARRIGMDAIGVEWGVHDNEQLAQHQPVAIVSSVEELRLALHLR